MSAEQRLKDLGITLPAPPRPLGAYVEAVLAGNLLFLSGALPVEGGAPKFQGRIGDELTLEDGRAATRLATRMVAGVLTLPVGVCVVVELVLSVDTE